MVIILNDIFRSIFLPYGTPWGEASPRSIRNHLSDISGDFLKIQRETKAISIPDPKVINRSIHILLDFGQSGFSLENRGWELFSIDSSQPLNFIFLLTTKTPDFLLPFLVG